MIRHGRHGGIVFIRKSNDYRAACLYFADVADHLFPKRRMRAKRDDERARLNQGDCAMFEFARSICF